MSLSTSKLVRMLAASRCTARPEHLVQTRLKHFLLDARLGHPSFDRCNLRLPVVTAEQLVALRRRP